VKGTAWLLINSPKRSIRLQFYFFTLPVRSPSPEHLLSPSPYSLPPYVFSALIQFGSRPLPQLKSQKSPSAPLDRHPRFPWPKVINLSLIHPLAYMGSNSKGLAYNRLWCLLSNSGECPFPPSSRHLTLSISLPSLSWSGYEPGSTVTITCELYVEYNSCRLKISCK
jgi:hypothetical protein